VSKRHARRPALLADTDASLLDVVDHVLNKGVSLDGDIVLGVADVDLIFLRLRTLLCAADRVPGGTTTERAPEPERDVLAASGSRRPRAAVPAGPVERRPVPAGPVDRRPVPAGPRRADQVSRVALAPGPVRATSGRRASRTSRWNASPEDAQRSVAKLVLALVEFVRKLMERQAVRRMDQGTLSSKEVESVGLALMKLEETVHDLALRFGIDPEDLELDLGPLGRLG
jgi:hypothetical protein